MDPAHPALFKANTALPWFERLRAESPVHWCEESQFGPYWSLTRYDDVKYVDTHHGLFSSDIMNGGIRLGGRKLEAPPDPMFHLPMFIMADSPAHEAQRMAVAPMFAPSKLGRLGDLIRARAGTILDELPRGETFNWVRRVSVELTGQMLATLFDVPQEDRHKLIHWSDTVERISDPDYFETFEDGFQELWKCFEYFNALWQERAAAPEQGEDLISFLARGGATRNMTPSEFLGNVLLLIVGGNDTTRNSISGGVLALNEFPGGIRQAQGQPRLESPTWCRRSFAGSRRWRTCAARPWKTLRFVASGFASGTKCASGIYPATAMNNASPNRTASGSTAPTRASTYPSALAFTAA